LFTLFDRTVFTPPSPVKYIIQGSRQSGKTEEAKEYGGEKSPSGVQGRSPGRGLEDKIPQELKHFGYVSTFK